jgi:hypothetical protein
MKNLAPIILFVYNRPDHTAKTIAALQKNNLAKDSELFVFCDGPKNEKMLEQIAQVHQIIDNISGFKKVVVKKLALNRGLANSVISAIDEVFKNYDRAIIIEDDIVTLPLFLEFMNKGLEFYEEDQRVFSITGFNYPLNIFRKPKDFAHDIFFVEGRGSSWSWATWRNRWSKVDFSVADYNEFRGNKKLQNSFNKKGSNLSEMMHLQMSGKIDSWAIRVAYHQFKNKLVTIFPIQSFVRNIGFDGSGSHKDFDREMIDSSIIEAPMATFQKIDTIKDNNVVECEYVRCTAGDSRKVFTKKSIHKFKYFIIGFVCATLFFLLF